MLYLSSFFGRTVSNVIVKSEITLKFTDFSIVFPTEIYAHKEAVYFHFSGSQYITFPLNKSVDKKIRLVNKTKESVLKLDDEKEFENI
jgi:hypothetical protein